MEQNDVTRLWALLRELYPRQPQTETKERKAAWYLALEPFDYETVRKAALAHSRRSDYYPSVSEIVAGIPHEEPQEDPQGERGSKKDAWMDYYGRITDEEFERKGGACHLFRDFHGPAGEIINAHYPEDCGECRRREVSGCPYSFMKKEPEGGEVDGT